MNKAYSNKALPSGTVLREWRLEEVLGVGGFGIVYKARGIYFNELVAIKEYFPSSTSERDGDDTVVPIDSKAEDVHALGLKKFVEEAKLLWNLSTPTRHPNIVSVRSLFEVHGTAYMVMDFEDGISLSKMLKQGRRFNERSLWDILHPIAEGLDRAHRVGVLHRDIKPPNILINEDSRPVLIDFGSARFEAAEATSTSITFHTPPYAAIEQYVKTYPQGPWTDVYALGVVMHECITGEKPPEVLERLHAGLGKPLAEGKWPGYSKRFLAAVDAAMIVKPDERPQSLSEWLAMFGRDSAPESDDEATRFFVKQLTAEDIAPVGAAAADSSSQIETGVPKDPRHATFKGAGQETAVGRKAASESEAVAVSDLSREQAEAAGAGDGAAAAAKAATAASAKTAPKPERRKPAPALLAAGIALAVVIVGGGGYLMLRGGSPQADVVPIASADVVSGPVVSNAAEAGALDANAAATATVSNTPAPAPTPVANAADAAQASQAKAAAAQAKLAAAQRAAAKAAKAQAAKAAKVEEASAAAAATAPAAVAGGGVSKAKLSQFYSIVDAARGEAKRVMRSDNRQNAALAKSYDSNLKVLRDSIRGVQSDREADRLIRQASQTRAYVDYLARQQ